MEKLYPLMANKFLEEEEEKKGLQPTQPQPTQPIQNRFDIPLGTAEELNTQLQSAQTPPPPAQTGVPQPVSVTPEPAFQFAPQVAVPVTKTQTQTTEKSVVMPPAYGQAQQELDALQPAKQKNLEEAARIGQAAADLENAAIDAKIKADEQNQIKQAELTKKREEEFSRVDADLQAKADAISKHEIKDFFADKSTFSKIMLGIATGVGQYSSVVGGGSNNAMVIIQNAIDNDFRQQKAVLDKMKSDYDISKGRRGLTQEKYDRAVSDLNMTHAQALSKAGDLIKQKAVTQVKKPEIQQQLEANSIALQERAAQMKQVEAEKLKREVVKTTQTDQSVQIVGGLKPETVKEVQNFDNSSKSIQGYNEAKNAYQNFKTLPPGAAIVDFMATGMKQGSFSPEMVEMLKKRNLVDKAGEVIRENWSGGVDPELMKDLEKGLKALMAIKAKEAKDDISISNQLRAQAGLPTLTQIQPEEQKPNRGAVMRKPK
jgi:hypothetical protein